MCLEGTPNHLPPTLRFPGASLPRHTEERATGVPSSMYGGSLGLFLLPFLILGVMNEMFVHPQNSCETYDLRAQFLM